MHDDGMFLNRKGVPISRGESLGDVRGFEVRLTIRCLGTNYDHDAEDSTFKPDAMRTKYFDIMSAQEADSMFPSVPHQRLLLIAL